MKLLYSVFSTSLLVASNTHPVAASVALRGEEKEKKPEKHRDLKEKKTHSDNLFSTSASFLYEPKVTAESALLVEEAKDAAAGFELLFDGTCNDDDSEVCSNGPNTDASVYTSQFASSNIIPWLKSNGGEEAQDLSPQDLFDVLTFEGTDDPYDILDEQLVAYNPSEGGRRLGKSCPNYNANRCRAELRALTRRSLTISYGAMTFTATGRMADLVMNRFNDNHWCTMEDWFEPLILANGFLVLASPAFWAIGTMGSLCVLALATGFSATGFNGFLSIVDQAHRWYEWLAFGVIWTASTAASIKTGGLSTLAAITIALAVSGTQLSIDIADYMQCIA